MQKRALSTWLAKACGPAAVSPFAMVNILTSLSAGSGIDVKALTEQLVAAEKEPRQKLLTQRSERVEARISAMGQFRTAIDALVSALDTRLASGALSGIPAVTDPSVVTFTVDPGVTVPRQNLEVRQLARGQTLASAPVADAGAAVGQGTLTIRFGSVAGTAEAGALTPSALDALTVEIGPGDDSLIGLRNAINDAAAVAGAPIQAQIVSDAAGARLMLRGSLGDASGFVVETSGDAALEAFRFGEGVGGGLQRTQSATDAIVAIEGVELRRPANSITDLIPGVRFSLAKAAPGQILTLEAVRDPSLLSQSVRDVTAALNELAGLGRELSNGKSGSIGALVADSATRRALQQLSGLTTQSLVPAAGNAPTRLSDIGISLDRYGNFLVDEARLSRAVTEHPASVEQLITALNRKAEFGQEGGQLRQLAEGFRLAAEGGAGQPTALQREKESIAQDQAALDARIEAARLKYTQQFAALDLAVGRSKSTQSYLQQQIDLWTRSRN
ncbi:flagellar filament capping protein FliD [Sandaracinobacter sp. RS1-74]|uniref:flagellar filament capping protein FliD n=1 Tax=Sandaracinobacteroides sayramensis TaxID=2913411 RepID=UPI001EDACD98|nr:flagellar filament capping protein FliD [Sandaracinobacteroides sayramensis]MCG2840755.1 flagellar filament capping protein FliD [Sandaracinobacteroides sayramensis]